MLSSFSVSLFFPSFVQCIAGVASNWRSYTLLARSENESHFFLCSNYYLWLSPNVFFLFLLVRSFVRSSSGHSMRCIAHEKPTHAFDYPLNSHIEPVLLEMKILFSDWLIRHFKNKNWPVYHSLIDTVTRYNVKRQGEELIAAPEYWS